MKSWVGRFVFSAVSFCTQVFLVAALVVAASHAAYTDNGNGTVTDTSTGLIWMRCSMGQTWSGGTCTGTAPTNTWADALALSTTSFAGQSDWRLPTIRELQSIVDRSIDSPTLDRVAFPNTPSVFFWSASDFAGYRSNVWGVSFSNGLVSVSCGGGCGGRFRLVRAGQSLGLLNMARPTSDYVDHGDGTATHTPTGLMWKRCTQGQTWTGSTCSGSATKYTWDVAIATTDGFAGHADWRLPTDKEIETLVDYTTYNPAVNATIFPATPASSFWTTSVDASNTLNAWPIDLFSGGFPSSYAKTIAFQVRLVRTGTTPNATPNVLAGWNLLGNSSSTALNVASAFGDGSKVTAVWKWIAPTAKWAFYTPTQTDGGVAYAASKGFDALTSVAGGEGFWVNAKTSFTAAFPTGTAIDSASFKNLASGWSLLATADNKTPSEFNNTLSFTTPAAGEIPNNFTSLWAWDAALDNWYLYAPSLEQSGGLASYVSSKGYLNFAATNKKLGQGVGFWVNKSNPYTVGPVLPGTTTLESKSVTTASGQSAQIQLSDGTSLNLPNEVTVITASLNRQSNTLDLSSSGVETTGSMREVAITPSGSVPENYTLGITLPAAEYGSINPETVTVARIGDLIIDGQVMRDAITYLAVTRAVNGDLQVTDPFVADTIAAAGGVTSGLSADMSTLSGSLRAAAVPAPVKIKYVVVTFQRNLNWSKASQLVRMVPKVSEPARRVPLGSLSAADQATELKRCSQNVVVLVHGHNEAEKIGYSPSSITVGQPWQQSYKRDVWTNFYDKFLSDFNTAEKNAQCTVFYEFIYPSYRSIFLHLGDELALMLAQEFKPQIAAKQNFNLFIVAHSQGGLVSRAAIQQFTQRAPELHAAFQRLVTWGSPHHGSPLNTLRYVYAAAPAYDLVLAEPPNLWFRTGYSRIRDYLANQAVDTPGTRDLRWDNQRALSLNDWYTMSSDQKANFHAAWYDLSNGVNLYNANLAALNAGDIYGKSSAPRNKLNKQKYLFMYGITTSAYANWGTWTHLATNYEVSFGAMLIPKSLKDASSRYLDTTLGGNDGASPVTSMAADGIDGLQESLGDVDHAQYYGAPDAPGHFTKLGLAVSTANLTLAYLELKESVYACPPTITTVSPASGVPDTPVTIAGTGFGATQGRVTFGFGSASSGTTATVTAWSDTRITTIVPTGASMDPAANVFVITAGGQASYGYFFRVTGTATDPPVTSTGEYTNNGDGTITQNKPGSNKVMWQQEDDGVLRSWDDATAYCVSLSLGGYSSGWKLPTQTYLGGLVDKSQAPTINAKYFTNTKKSIYWTSTAAGGAYMVYYVDFSDGSVSYTGKNQYDYYARCMHSLPATP